MKRALFAPYRISLMAIVLVNAGCMGSVEGNPNEPSGGATTTSADSGSDSTLVSSEASGSATEDSGAESGGSGQMPPSEGSLIITEIMPSTPTDPIAWFELYNPGQTALELGGCAVSDDASDLFMVEAPTTVEPGQFAVFASEPDSAPDAPAALKTPTYVFDRDQFNLSGDTPDSLRLVCGDTLVDEASYEEYKPAMARGARALQLHPDRLTAIDNDLVTNWCNVPLDRDELNYNMHNHASAGVSNPPCDIFPYFYYEQEDVLLEGVDFNETVKVATLAAAKGGTTSLMVLWAMRDQAIDPANAADVGLLYLDNIEAIYDATGETFDWNFGVWHSAWAISNLYRNGSVEVKAALQSAYDDAVARPATLEQFVEIANLHVLGDKPVMGDVHNLGRALAQRSLVIPGNPDYLQSAEDYR